MELQLQRKSDDGQGTIGVLSLVHNAVRAPNTGYRMSNLVTLEDTFNRVKIVHESRIPAGRYRILHRAGGDMHTKYQRRFADAHEGMFWLQEVPGFSWIYIHIGNDPKDTSGCILVGMSTTSGHTIARSADAYRVLAKTINSAFARGEEVWITIKDEVTRVETSPFPPDMGHPYVDRGKLPSVSAMIKRVDGLEGRVKVLDIANRGHNEWEKSTDPQLEVLEKDHNMLRRDVSRLQRFDLTLEKLPADVDMLFNDYKALANEVTELGQTTRDLIEDDEAADKMIADLAQAVLLVSKESKERDIDINKRLNSQGNYLDQTNSRISKVSERTVKVDGDLEKAVTRIDSLDQRSNTLVNRIDAVTRVVKTQLHETDGALLLRLKSLEYGRTHSNVRIDSLDKRSQILAANVLDSQKRTENTLTDHHEELETQRAEINDLKETVAALTTAFPIDAIITRLKKLEAK